MSMGASGLVSAEESQPCIVNSLIFADSYRSNRVSP
jgi:hypothetical protein